MGILDTIFESVEELSPFDAVSNNATGYVSEEAKFTILPRFKRYSKQYPDLGEHEALINETEALLMKTGDGPIDKTMANKIARTVIKYVSLLESIGEVILWPFCILIAPFFGILISRLWQYAVDTIDYKLAKNTSQKAVKALRKAKERSKDKKYQKKIDEMIKKIEDNYDKMSEIDKKAKDVKESADFDVDDLNDNDFDFDMF